MMFPTNKYLICNDFNNSQKGYCNLYEAQIMCNCCWTEVSVDFDTLTYEKAKSLLFYSSEFAEDAKLFPWDWEDIFFDNVDEFNEFHRCFPNALNINLGEGIDYSKIIFNLNPNFGIRLNITVNTVETYNSMLNKFGNIIEHISLRIDTPDWHNEINDEGFTLFTDNDLKRLKGIKHLDISYNAGFTGEFFESIQGIETLNLDYCIDIQERFLIHLQRIQELNISHINGISTNAIQYLIKFPNLVLIV